MITLSSTTSKEPIPPLLKIRDVAQLLGVSRTTVHNLIETGDIEAATVSSSTRKRPHKRITRKSLVDFYKKRFGHPLNRALQNPFDTNLK
jgi:excisionase family DNA binding protein